MCCPTDKFGVGSPFSLSIAPSVPPRMEPRTQALPSLLKARSAKIHYQGLLGKIFRHVAILSHAGDFHLQPRHGSFDFTRQLSNQLFVVIQLDESKFSQQ